MAYSALTDTIKKGRVIFAVSLFVIHYKGNIDEKSYDYRNRLMRGINELFCKQW